MSSGANRADLIVVGLGAMGAAVAFHASRLGMSVVGIDRFDPPHDRGSTHAETRITRLAVGEGPQYLPFVARSHEIWRQIEAETGETVLHECGGLIVTEPVLTGSRWQDFVVTTGRIAHDAGIAYTRPSPDEVRGQYPELRIPDANNVGFEPSAGLVMAERAVDLQLGLAADAGASIRRNEEVVAIETDGDGVRVETGADTYRAGHVVVATGPWLPAVVPASIGRSLRVTRQVVFWFEAEQPDRFSTEVMPYVMWVGETDEDYFSVFPIPPGGTRAVKTMGEQFIDATTADGVNRSVSEDEIAEFHRTHVATKLAGVTSACVRAAVCLYTNTPDDHFVVDCDPRSDRILVMSPCSGHGFKHSTALGEAVAQRIATGSSRLDLTPFAAP